MSHCSLPTERFVFSSPVAQNALMSIIPKTRLILLLALCVSSLQCNGPTGDAPAKKATSVNAAVPKYGYEIVNSWPHDSNAFTQGLISVDGKLLESTGQEGYSSLRSVELETGQIRKKVDGPVPYFAEGITVVNEEVHE